MTKDIDLSEFYKTEQRVCKTGVEVAKLNEDDRAKIEKAFTVEDITTSSIKRFLRERDIEVSEKPITAHRRKECVCYK